MGFLDHYRQFRALPPEEVSRRLREEAAERRARALEQAPPLDLSDTAWHEPPHPESVSAATYALRRSVHRLADPGARAVRDAAAARHGVEPGQVTVGHGAGELLLAALRHLATGREVVVPWPSWLLLPAIARRAGASPRQAALGPDGTLEVEAVLREVGEDTAAVVVASPNDPTGLLTDVDALRERLPGHVWLVVDEALAEWAEPDPAAISVRDRVLRLRSLSKAHALAGLRAGYAIGPADLVAELAPLQGIGAPAQAAMTWALTEGDAALDRRRGAVEAERRRLAAGLRGTSMSLGPSRASFVWLSSSRHGAADIVAALSRRAVLVASGAAWGDERHVRLALRDEAATVRVLAALRDLG